MGRRNHDWLECTRDELIARRAEFERRRRTARQIPQGPETTLGQMRSPWGWLSCEIAGCGHHVALPLVPFRIRWGPNAPRSRFLTCFRCTRCGGRQTMIRWPSRLGDDTYPAIDAGRRWTGAERWPEPLSMHYLDDVARGHRGELDFSPVLGTLNFETMCNLYSNTKSRDAIRALFRISDNRAVAIEPQPAIFPRTVAPIVRLASDGERELVHATWGFPLLRKGYAPKPVTNVRDDTVLTSPFWRPSFEARRCLVPASSYCDPDSNSPAGWHWFSLLPPEERPLFAFPGIWKRYRGPMKKDGPNVEVDVYAFVTTTPNELTATIMHDRMPVLLNGATAFDTWLNGSPDEAYRLVQTYPADGMRIVQSGSEKTDLLAGVTA